MLFQLDRKVFGFAPDMAMFVGHESDLRATSRWWARMVHTSVLPRNAFNDDLLRRSGLTADAGPNETRRRLRPFEPELLGWVYRQFVAECRERGVTPSFVYLEKVTDDADPDVSLARQRVTSLAANAGFIVLDASDVFDRRGSEPLGIAENDDHANAAGNRLIAERLYTLLSANRAKLGLDRRSR